MLVVVVFGFFTLAVAFGVTLTLTTQEPLESAFTDVPDTEQNFFDFAATTSATLAPFGTLTLAVLRIVVKEATLPFFITTDCVGLATTPPVGLATLEAATHGRLFTRTQIVFVATAPVARIRYLVETVGHITKVAFPFEPVFAVNDAEQLACAVTFKVRTVAGSLIERVDTPPLAQMVVTLSVDAMSPPCSQLEPGFTVSTDWDTPVIGILSSSTKSVTTVTPPVASALMSMSGVVGSASVSIAGVVGSASGNVTLIDAINGITTVSVIEANIFLTFWFSSPSSYETSASYADERDNRSNDEKVTEPSAPVAYFGGATKQYAQFIWPR